LSRVSRSKRLSGGSRVACLQVVYLAYPGTMGATYIDYNVVDWHVCPKEHRLHLIQI
jgi:predicted O-linked N-acetylglucosamine transferase (SPINDLY family)